MKCRNCGSELLQKCNWYECDFCGSRFRIQSSNSFQTSSSTGNNTGFNISGGILTAYIGVDEDVFIPDGVVAIGRGAFSGNLAVRSVHFPDSVVRIEKNAFSYCTNLRSIFDYGCVAEFGDDCFRCSGLTEMNIGSNVISIGNGSFSYMPELRSLVYKPGKNLSIKNAFAHCENLYDVEMDKNYFFPSFHKLMDLENNQGNKRPTLADGFVGTAFIKKMRRYRDEMISKKTCMECGGVIEKKLFHAKCNVCGIDYVN